MVKLSGSTSAAKAPKKTTAKAAPKKTTAKAAPKTATKAAAKPAPVKASDSAPAPETAIEVTPAPVAPAPVEAELAAVEPKLVKTQVPVVAGPEMKKKELVEKIVKRAGVKKKDAKPVVEAMLAVLGEALGEGRELVLQPLGRIKVTKVKDTGTGRVMICRLRQGGGDGKGDKEALAEDDD